MFYDIITVTQKELKEIVLQRGSLRSGLTNVLVSLGVIGILFPLQFGPAWLSSPIALISTAWLPLFMAMGLVADAFAGERERHTLETLLASRLSDQAILYGKMLTSILYSSGITLAGMLIGAVTINVMYPGAGFYPLTNFIGAILFSLLGALLVSGIGVLVSLNASSVRQAYQRMSLGFIMLWLPLILAPQWMPDAWGIQLGQWLANMNEQQVALAVAAALILFDLILVILANLRFKRARLILE
jgi:ABC-2 type transport system permease protein